MKKPFFVFRTNRRYSVGAVVAAMGIVFLFVFCGTRMILTDRESVQTGAGQSVVREPQSLFAWVQEWAEAESVD